MFEAGFANGFGNGSAAYCVCVSDLNSAVTRQVPTDAPPRVGLHKLHLMGATRKPPKHPLSLTAHKLFHNLSHGNPNMSFPEPTPPTGSESGVHSDSVRTELRGCVFRGVKGFFAKYFEG